MKRILTKKNNNNKKLKPKSLNKNESSFFSCNTRVQVATTAAESKNFCKGSVLYFRVLSKKKHQKTLHLTSIKVKMFSILKVTILNRKSVSSRKRYNNSNRNIITGPWKFILYWKQNNFKQKKQHRNFQQILKKLYVQELAAHPFESFC